MIFLNGAYGSYDHCSICLLSSFAVLGSTSLMCNVQYREWKYMSTFQLKNNFPNVRIRGVIWL